MSGRFSGGAVLMCGIVAAVASLAGGCSRAGGDRGFGSARVEPELERSAAVVPGSGHRDPRVPVVITPPRPLSAAQLAARAGRPAAEPRRLLPAAARTTAAARPAAGGDVAAIRDMLGGYLQAFNRHDPAALVAHWSDRGENVDLDSGEVTAGREAVRDVFATLFAEEPASTIDIDIQTIRTVRADVAVVDGTSRITFGDGGRAGSRFSAVVVRQDGHWLLESVREAALVEAAEPRRPLDDLAWLVGTWEDDAPGMTATTRCFWSAGNSFLIRTHAVSASAVDASPPRPGDAHIPALLPAGEVPAREVTEIIGWDPERQAIRSWAFTSAGRFAEGEWSRDGGAWTVRFTGGGADAGRNWECTLVRQGDDGLSARGAGEGLGTALAPVCDFVRTAR